MHRTLDREAENQALRGRRGISDALRGHLFEHRVPRDISDRARLGHDL